MKRCPNCNHENTPSDSYCEQCGSLLATSAPYTVYNPPQQNQEVYGSPFSPPSEDYRSPSPPASNPYFSIPSEYAPPPPPVYATAFAPVSPQRTERKAGNIILSITLYLWGVTVACFGFAGGVLNQAPSTIIGLAFFLGLLVGILVLVLALLIHKRPHFRWWVRLLILLGASVVGAVALIVGVGLSESLHYQGTYPRDFVLGITFIVYGIVVAITALW